MSSLLSFDSAFYVHPLDIHIQLKDHQLAMIQRCIDIEKIPNNTFGILNDKPGTGKTYVILSLIYDSLLLQKTNIIVVPQNIYTQWMLSIETFSSKLTYQKFIHYENIVSLYHRPELLQQTHILLTTSSYYHLIATTLESLNIGVHRVFLDEIDSISNIICTKMKSDFIWFVSASFQEETLGYYRYKIPDIDEVTCHCDNAFIDANIYLTPPEKVYYLCENIYIDHILDGIITQKELHSLNAMDYTLSNRDFENLKAKNETDVIELIFRNRKTIIHFDKISMEEAQSNIVHYTKYHTEREQYIKAFQHTTEKSDQMNLFQKKLFHTDVSQYAIDPIDRKQIKSNFETWIELLHTFHSVLPKPWEEWIHSKTTVQMMCILIDDIHTLLIKYIDQIDYELLDACSQ